MLNHTNSEERPCECYAIFDRQNLMSDNQTALLRVSLRELADLDPRKLPVESRLRIDVTTDGVSIPLLVVPRAESRGLVVLCNGAVELEKSNGEAVFQRSSWWKQIHAHQIYVCDPGTVGPYGLSLNWFQAAPPQWPIRLVAKAVNELARALGVTSSSDRLYFGSSAGGFAALQLLSYTPRARAIVNNAQFDWTRWYAPAVKSVLDSSFPGADAATVRRRWPHRANALKALARRDRSPRIDFWCNSASDYDRTVQLPIIQEFIRNQPKLSSHIAVHLYEDAEAGHNPMTAQQTIELLNDSLGYQKPAALKGSVMTTPSSEDKHARAPFACEGEHADYKVPVKIYAKASEASITPEPQIVAVPIPGGPHLQAYGRMRPSRVLRVVFHGAVSGGAVNYPYFDQIPILTRSQDAFLSIADPTLVEDAELTLTWYAGTSKWDPSSVIHDLINQAMKASGAEEVWFFGDSGGGLAAMRFARLVDNALVFVSSPQTDASKYRGRRFPDLMSSCFEGLDAETAKAQFPGRFEVIDSYSQGSNAWIYYLQNLTDPDYITDHYLPFLRSQGIHEACGDSPDGRVRATLIAQERGGHGPLRPEEFEEHLTRAIEFLHSRLGRSSTADGPDTAQLEKLFRQSLKELSKQVDKAVETTNRTYRSLNRQLGLLPWNVEAYHRLAGQLVPEDRPLPPAGSFALRTPGIEELTRLISSARPAAIVECGSGSSTVWMAAQLEKIGADGHIYSLEHDPHYAQQTRDLLTRSGLDGRATVVEAPLQATVDISGRPVTWYSEEALDQLPQRCDLLFVDGPPSSKGRGVRAHALAALDSRLTTGGLIAVDDIQRPDEAAMVRGWLQREDLMEMPGFAELAVLIKVDTEDTNRSNND